MVWSFLSDCQQNLLNFSYGLLNSYKSTDYLNSILFQISYLSHRILFIKFIKRVHKTSLEAVLNFCDYILFFKTALIFFFYCQKIPIFLSIKIFIHLKHLSEYFHKNSFCLKIYFICRYGIYLRYVLCSFLLYFLLIFFLKMSYYFILTRWFTYFRVLT